MKLKEILMAVARTRSLSAVGKVITDEDTGVRFTPWTDGWAVGYRIEHPDGHVEYIYLNPSSDGGGDPDHRSNVCLYTGEAGDPAIDEPHHHYDVEHYSPVRDVPEK